MQIVSVRQLPQGAPPHTYFLAETAVQCGFPSPSQDYQTHELDLNEHLGLRNPSCYVVRAQGHSMQLAGIYDGDELIVDRSIRAQDGHVVVAIIDNELTVKRLRISPSGSVTLHPEHPDFPVIHIAELSDLRV